MNATETIRAAIERLELLHRAIPGGSIGGPWAFETSGAIRTETLDVITDYIDEDVAALVVTLHRTIDVQLSILRLALDWAADTDANRTPDEPWSGHNAFDLARAILGTTE